MRAVDRKLLWFLLFLFLPPCLAGQARKPIQFTYPNGLKVTYYHFPGLTLSKILLTVDTGEAGTALKGRGLAEVAFRSLLKGGAGFSEGSIRKTLQNAGAKVEVETDSERMALTISVPADKTKGILRFLASVFSSPALASTVVEKEKRELAGRWERARGDRRELFELHGESLLFGERHPYGKSANSAGVRKISLPQVRKFVTEEVAPANIEWTIVTSLSGEQVRDSLNFYVWDKRLVFKKAVPSVPQERENTFVETSLGDGKALVVLAGFLPGSYKETTLHLQLFLHLLNGYLGSRAKLFFLTRQGVAPESFFRLYRERGWVALAVEVSTDRVGETVNAFSLLKEEMGSSFPTDLEEKDGKASFVGTKYLGWQRLENYYRDILDLSPEKRAESFRLRERVQRVEAERIKKIGQEFLSTSRFIVLGDSVVRGSLKGFFRVVKAESL